MKSLTEQFDKEPNLFWQIHEKISSWSAQLLGPIVFNFGRKEEAWNIRTADLLKFPEGSTGKTLGEFLKRNRLEPIARAESHDLYHVLFGYSTSLKDEVALQFFLRGNGKTSIASFGTSIGAWFVFPKQWNYFKASYARGKRCMDLSRLDVKTLLVRNFDELRTSLFKENKTQSGEIDHE